MNRDSYAAFLLTDEREKILWEKSIIVFDSSALLDIYFLPKTARSKIYLEIFDKLPQRLWIPSQVQFEYLKNRESVIVKPIIEKYDPLKQKVRKIENVVTAELLRRIDEISRESKKDDKHPYIDQSSIDEFKKNIEDFVSKVKTFEENTIKQIETAESEVRGVKDADDVLEALEKSFEVGRDFSFDEILEITKEGKHRYEYKIPPGYGDFNSKDKKGTQIFGDLIIWKQILEFSKEKKLPILFITNDIKKDEDWCYLDKKVTEDRIFSPREELIKEITDFSGVDFWMYNLPQFLHNANKYLKSTIKEETIQNISQILNTKDKKGKYLKFECEECGKIHKYHELDLDLDFECVGGSERNMGAENQYVAKLDFECDCGNDITVEFELWEYPVGVHNYDSIEIEGAELIESFPFTINFFDDPDDGFYQCHICDGNNDNVGNYVDFYDKLPLDNEYDVSSPNHKYKFARAGNCQWCNTLHIKCPRCESITAISESDEDIECEGGCGLTFRKEMGDTPDDYESFTLKLIDHRKVKCASCGDFFVDHSNIGVCEKCDLKFNWD